MRIAFAGVVSGAVIPFLILLALDIILLALETSGLWTGPVGFGVPQRQPASQALELVLARGFAAVLSQFWRLRWMAVVFGGVGLLAALAGHHAASAGLETSRASFLTILTLSTFATSAVVMLSQETCWAAAASERVALMCYPLGTSHWVALILYTAIACLPAAVIWKLWRMIYGLLAHALRLPLLADPGGREASRKLLDPRSRGEWHSHQDPIHHLRSEAAVSHPARAAKSSWDREWQPLLLSLLTAMALWVPLQRAYLHVAPNVISDTVHLKPDEPVASTLLVVRSEPAALTFSTSAGQGTVDVQLKNGQGETLREVKGFRLVDLPGIAHNTITMPIADLSAGTYTLRLVLRPVKGDPGVGRAQRNPGGLITWGLRQGGGSRFRVLAVVAAGLATFMWIDVYLLLRRAADWLRNRYF